MRTALLLLAIVLVICAPAAADTGTYVIEKYEVTLTPHADGLVDIDSAQRWRVTGGHIPWITVGLPNGAFTITGSGGAVRSISPANEGGWSGVRIDLDRDYQPGQSLDISFAVKQNKLFYADGENYRLDYWPGWYDNAVTEALTIRLKYFVAPESITANPEPTAKTDEELVWSGMRLGKGEKYEIHVSFPKSAAPQAIPQGRLRAEREERGVPSSGGSESWIGLLIFGVILFIFVGLPLISLIQWLTWVAHGRKGHYTGGGIWWGGLGGGYGGGGGGGRGRGTGGGGGFGGAGFSCVCACACVSCACACACAGGGGAGCGRKLQHNCAKCREARRA